MSKFHETIMTWKFGLDKVFIDLRPEFDQYLAVCKFTTEFNGPTTRELGKMTIEVVPTDSLRYVREKMREGLQTRLSQLVGPNDGFPKIEPLTSLEEYPFEFFLRFKFTYRNADHCDVAMQRFLDLLRVLRIPITPTILMPTDIIQRTWIQTKNDPLSVAFGLYLAHKHYPKG